MEYKLTHKCQLNKRGKDNKSRSYLISYWNDIVQTERGLFNFTKWKPKE